MRTTVDRLILDAIDTGKNTTASNGRWKCRINVGMDAYIVTHHITDMLVLHGPRSKQPGAIYPLDPGWGSRTDKQGITSMLSTLAGQGYDPIVTTYHELYSGKPDESSRIAGPRVLDESSRMAGPRVPEDLWCSRCTSREHNTEDHPEPEPPKLEPFTPPLTVEDTMG